VADVVAVVLFVSVPEVDPVVLGLNVFESEAVLLSELEAVVDTLELALSEALDVLVLLAVVWFTPPPHTQHAASALYSPPTSS